MMNNYPFGEILHQVHNSESISNKFQKQYISKNINNILQANKNYWRLLLQSWEKTVFSNKPETHKPYRKILPDFTPNHLRVLSKKK